MSAWPHYPSIHEINTWVWLGELSRSAGRPVTLGSVPSTEWDAIAATTTAIGISSRGAGATATPRYLVILNLSGIRSQAHVRVPWDDLGAQTCRLEDVLTAQSFARQGDELRGEGLFVELPAWGSHFLQVQMLSAAHW